MIRGFWAWMTGCWMILFKLSLYRSKGTCCSWPGTHASLAPKKSVYRVVSIPDSTLELR